MQRSNAKPSRSWVWLEQAVVLATSLVWTAIVLLIIAFFWAYQDVQARWDELKGLPTPVPMVLYPTEIPTPTDTPTPTPTLTPLPTDTATPVPTLSPTATPTATGLPPDMLPETPLDGRPTPTPTPTPDLRPSPTVLPTRTTPTAVPPTPSSSSVAGAPTRLVIKSVGIDTPVMPVVWTVVEQNGLELSVWNVADYAAGWHQTSALPGQPGNTVLAGHHNIKGEVFRYLVDVQEGDEVDLYVGDTVYPYFVEQKLILKEKGEPPEVRRQNAQWIAPTNDVRVTLVTCWPYTNNTHRVIVVARPKS
jgi:LPXTG-site transpeptidase (sortase) family protein